MKLIGSIAVLAAFGLGCTPSVNSTTDSGQQAASESGGTHEQAANPAAALASLPANFQNDGFHYYGLSRSQPLTYVVTQLDAKGQTVTTGTGAEAVKFNGMKDGKAMFDIERTGALGPLGSEHVSLDADGVTVESTDPGVLEGHPIDLPASLTPGSTWKTDYKVTLPKSDSEPETTSQDHSTFKVVGPQKIKTKAGEYDAILVTSDGEDTKNSESFKLQTQSWYVKDEGAVKIIVTAIAGSQKTTLQIEAAPGDPK